MQVKIDGRQDGNMNRALQLLDGEIGAAPDWFNGILSRTRETDHSYVLQLQKATLCCLRRGIPCDLSARIAAPLPALVRGLWFEQWSPNDTIIRYKSTGSFLECVRPFVRDYYAEAVIEEDVLAVIQTFFEQWPHAAELSRPFFPADFFEQGEAQSAL